MVTVPDHLTCYRIERQAPLPLRVGAEAPMEPVAVIVAQPSGEWRSWLTPWGVGAVEIWRPLTG